MAIALLPVALAGCQEDAAPPGPVSADENHELNAAAEMLDANSVSADALNAEESESDGR